MTVLAQCFGAIAARRGETPDERVHLVAERPAAARPRLADLGQQPGRAQLLDRGLAAFAGQRHQQIAAARPAQHARPHQQVAGTAGEHPIPKRIEQQIFGQLHFELRQGGVDDLRLFVLRAQAAGLERTVVVILPAQDRAGDQRFEELDGARMAGEPRDKPRPAGSDSRRRLGNRLRHSASSGSRWNNTTAPKSRFG